MDKKSNNEKVIGACTNCKYLPDKLKAVKSHVCKYKGEWEKYHRGGKYDLDKCTHSEIGGKDCSSTKFIEGICEADYIPDPYCERDNLGWCKGLKEKQVTSSLQLIFLNDITYKNI